jgi:Zn-dependent M28 family amino/carboxypeptidase
MYLSGILILITPMKPIIFLMVIQNGIRTNSNSEVLMNRRYVFPLILIILFTISLFGQTSEKYDQIIGSAFQNNQSYEMLEHLCDEAGGRLVGSAQNEHAMQIMQNDLKQMGWKVKLEKFRIPGWVRRDDRVVMTQPTRRRLQAVALGYTEKTPEFSAPLIYAETGWQDDYDKLDAKDKIVLVTSEKVNDKQPPLRYEAIEFAAEQGAKAILFINTKPGALNLAGTGHFQGHPTAIPAFSLTYEEGKWLYRLLQNKTPVTVDMTVNSYCKDIETANVVLSLKGETDRKIVVGAHFDSWDLGQGGIDNGVGTAILYEVARLMKTYSQKNYYSIDFVWFNGEELGLWGSKNYVQMHKDDRIATMINMDMTGSPTGLNAMGFDEFIPILESVEQNLEGFDLKRGVISRPWTNSDHMPFMLQGIPTLSLTAHLDEDMGKYYHSAGDTFDKVNKKYLSEAAAVVAVLLTDLANEQSFSFPHKTAAQTAEMLKKFHLDEKLKRQKEWIFSKNQESKQY